MKTIMLWKKQTQNLQRNCVDWAENELNDGWYGDVFSDMDFRGAPNPLDFIDMEKFGQALIDTVDPCVAYQCSDGRVVEVR